MRVFLSYSLNNHDLYILTLLASELKKRGFTINQSNDFHSEMSSLTKVNINKSNLFIGLITGDGLEYERVHSEWRLANIATIPSIMLVENKVSIDPNFNFPYIIFDRNNPQFAVNELSNRINEINKNLNKNSDAWAWILGGAALYCNYWITLKG